jgi:hypothetical protein
MAKGTMPSENALNQGRVYATPNFAAADGSVLLISIKFSQGE